MLLFLQNSMLVVNFNRILMGESWGDPQEFRPDRFIDESGKIVMPEDYLPFSFGNKKKNQISIIPFVEIQRNLFLFHIIRFSSRIVQYCILLSQASIAVWAKCWPRATSSWSLRRCCSAKSNIFMITAALLQHFTFSPVPGEEPPRNEYTDGVTASPKPYRVLMTRRT